MTGFDLAARIRQVPNRVVSAPTIFSEFLYFAYPTFLLNEIIEIARLNI